MRRYFVLLLFLFPLFGGCGGGGDRPTAPLVVERFLLVDGDLEPVGGPETADACRDVRIAFVFSGRVTGYDAETILLTSPDVPTRLLGADGSFRPVEGRPRWVVFDPTLDSSGEECPLGLPANARIEVLVPSGPDRPGVRARSGGRRLAARYRTWFGTGEKFLPRRSWPEVVSMEPEDGDTGISWSADIVARFSAPMDESTFRLGETVFVRNVTLDSEVSGSLTLSPDLRTLTFRPDPDYGQGPVVIFFRMTLAVRDLGGNPLPREARLIFTTYFQEVFPDFHDVMETFDGNDFEDPDYASDCGRALWDAPGTEGLLVAGEPCPDGSVSARSRFYDTGFEDPQFLEPLLYPDAADRPAGTEVALLWQGSPDGASELSDWVTDLRELTGYRHVRFRVELYADEQTGTYPILEEIIIPFLLW